MHGTGNKHLRGKVRIGMSKTEKIQEFAEQLACFFLVFDATFVHDEEAEELLKETQASLEEKISFNNSALPVIMAMGSTYQSDMDSAKTKEIDALIKLIAIRKRLRELAEEEHRKKRNRDVLSNMFGM